MRGMWDLSTNLPRVRYPKPTKTKRNFLNAIVFALSSKSREIFHPDPVQCINDLSCIVETPYPEMLNAPSAAREAAKVQTRKMERIVCHLSNLSNSWVRDLSSAPAIRL